MPKLNLVHEHSLTKEEATERLTQLFTQLKAQYGGQLKDFKETWSEDQLEYSFSAMGFSTEGFVRVEERAVRIQGHIPLAASMFKGRIESAIRDELNRQLS